MTGAKRNGSVCVSNAPTGHEVLAIGEEKVGGRR